MNNDKPRERLARLGAKALKTDELIAILLATGNKEKNVYDLSSDILDKLLSLDDLKKLTLDELLTIKGIKIAKASKIIAAVELGRRLNEIKSISKVQINKLDDIYQMVSYDLNQKEQEHFIVIYLDSKSSIIKQETIFIGTINQTIIHPREIFKSAIRLNAVAILCLHNHPTGNSDPSKSDIRTTNELVKASQIIGIDMIDHLVIGRNEYFSIIQNKKFFIRK